MIKGKELFWTKIDKSGGPDACWPWSLTLDADGYARTQVLGQRGLVHRFAYEFSYEAPVEGIEVCHTCDNRSCCNPRHLFLGTHQDNMIDMVQKGRFAHTLTQEQVTEIRLLVGSGLSQTEIGKRFQVDNTTIWHIAHGYTHKEAANEPSIEGSNRGHS